MGTQRVKGLPLRDAHQPAVFCEIQLDFRLRGERAWQPDTECFEELLVVDRVDLLLRNADDFAPELRPELHAVRAPVALCVDF